MSDTPTDGSQPPVAPPPPSPPKVRRLLPSGFSTLRDLLTFAAGMVVIFNEVFFSRAVEPYALGVGIALCGLPLALQADERRGQK